MAQRRRTGFAFQSSAFNTTEPREYFINPECYGDDAARWMMVALHKQGLATAEEPGQEDFGWFFSFQSGGEWHDVVLGYRPGEDPEPGEWLCWVERRAGLIGSLFGRRNEVLPDALAAVEKVLATSPEVSAWRSGPEEEL